MSTTNSDAKVIMSQRTDSPTRTESTSITRLLSGKGSKSIIPKGSTPAALAHQNICHPPSANEMIEDCGKSDKTMTPKGEASVQSNPGEQTPRSRVSALPTFTLSRRTAMGKTVANSNSSITNKSKIGVNCTLQKRQLENQFATKRQKYVMLRKELVEKQKQALDLYEDVSELREKVIAAGLKDPGKIEKLSQVKNEGRESTGTRDGAAGEQLLSNYTMSSVITSDFIGTLEGKLKEIPKVCLEVCNEALTKRTEFIAWIVGLNEKKPDGFNQEIIERLEIDKIENEELLLRLENIADKQQAVVNEVFQNTSALWGEHENYKIHIRELETSGEGLIRDLKEKLSAKIEDLQAEEEKVAQLKERKNVADVQLQKTKAKIREFENQANNNEAKIQQLQTTVKHLETQIKQKETTIEARTKDMHKSMKNSEGLIAKAEKQRDSLESRVNDLKKKIESKEAESNEKIKNLSKQLEDTKNELAKEKDSKCQAEKKLKESNDRCVKLEEKSQQLCDLAKTAKDLVAKPEDGKHTKNEMQLWNDLQSTRAALAAKDDELLQVQREKEQIISVLQEAAARESPGSVNDKLAAELVSKTEELQIANTERAQLQKSLKTAIERGDNFEKQLSDLQNKLHAQSKEGGKTGWGAHAIELQQQLFDLRTNLKDLNQHNEELETALTQKQLEVEQRDRIMREQSKVLKVRDELIGLLKVQGPNANGESIGPKNGTVDQQMQLDPENISRLVNKQIAAKAEDLQALYSTLESKQMQLMRLEKVVRQMEEDNDRSQATRTKLEKEVARLRLQLHEKNRDRRYVGVKPAVNIQRPNTSPHTITGDSRSLSRLKFPQNLPNLPVPVPIRSRHSSANSMGKIIGKKILNDSPTGETPSVQKLRDIIRAVEIERARGSSVNPKRVSRSLKRSNTLENSTEIREDLYNWLMHPAGVYDPEATNSKREFVRHSRALFNGELSKIPGTDFRNTEDKVRRDNTCDDKINGGSREFGRRYKTDSSFAIRTDSTTRIKSKRERIRVLK